MTIMPTLQMDVIKLVKLRPTGLVMGKNLPFVKTYVLMESTLNLQQLIVMMEVLYLVMGAQQHVQLKQDGNVLEEP